jgi:hypothetical protein
MVVIFLGNGRGMNSPFTDKRPKALKWVDEFGEEHWKSPKVDDKMSETSLLVLQNAMKGRKINDTQRRAAEFVAAHKAWPQIRDGSTININVLRLEDIEAAKIKAGLIPRALKSPCKVIEGTPDAQSNGDETEPID